MNAAHIRRELRKRSESLFFTNAERALLAILDADPFGSDRQAIINADYTNARKHAEKRVRTLIEDAWKG